MIKDKCLLSWLVLIVAGILALGCQNKTFDQAWLKEKAPAEFTIRFETTKGNFDVRIYSAWSPLAADRLYQLVDHKYFDYAIFYRVTADYVAQFGNSNRVLTSQWMSNLVPDEPVLHSNKRGTITFARAARIIVEVTSLLIWLITSG
jgi:peptidyl-prolyl cis-trans isomerase A (cyclophilin A)